MNKKIAITLVAAVIALGAVLVIGNQYVENLTKSQLPTGVSLPPKRTVEPSGAVDPRPAPELTLPTLTGETVSFKDFQGRPTVINFWATW